MPRSAFNFESVDDPEESSQEGGAQQQRSTGGLVDCELMLCVTDSWVLENHGGRPRPQDLRSGPCASAQAVGGHKDNRARGREERPGRLAILRVPVDLMGCRRLRAV